MTQSQEESVKSRPDDARLETEILERLEALGKEQSALELALREVRNRLGTNKHDKNSAYCIEGRRPEYKASR